MVVNLFWPVPDTECVRCRICGDPINIEDGEENHDAAICVKCADVQVRDNVRSLN